jgi:hypothetical protein
MERASSQGSTSQGGRYLKLEVLGLDRFTVLVNIETARALELYPPPLLHRYAATVNTR